MESENSFWNRRDFLKVGGTSVAALGLAETAAVPIQAEQATAGTPPDTPYPKLSIITPYSPLKLAFAAQAGYEGVVVTPGRDFNPNLQVRIEVPTRRHHDAFVTGLCGKGELLRRVRRDDGELGIGCIRRRTRSRLLSLYRDSRRLRQAQSRHGCAAYLQKIPPVPKRVFALHNLPLFQHSAHGSVCCCSLIDAL